MPINAGQMLSHYRLAEKIGEGGMGVVWRAEDTVLRRDVALKFLPEGFDRDPERTRRFQREARTLASLNHPNIAAIHGFEEADSSTPSAPSAGSGQAGSGGGTRFLAMELVPGEDLAQRLIRGRLPVDEAVGASRARSPKDSRWPTSVA